MANLKLPPLWSRVDEESFNTPFPFKRSWHSAFIYEKEMFIFAGSFLVKSDLYVFNDLHAYNLETNTWRKITTSGDQPKGMWACSIVLITDNTSKTNKELLRNPFIIIFGGRDPELAYNYTYTLDLTTFVWTKLSDKMEGVPTARCAASLSIDNTMQAVLFGGDSTGNGYHNDVWTLQCNKLAWKFQPTRGTIPSARSAHCQAIVNNSLWVFGGTNGEYIFNDIHQLDLDTWTWKRIAVDETTTPSPRYGSSMTHIGKNLIILGGDSRDSCTKVWNFDTEKLKWSSIECPENSGPPSKIFGHSTVLYNRKLYIFGGQDEENYMKSLYILDHSLYLKRVTMPKSNSSATLLKPSPKNRAVTASTEPNPSRTVVKQLPLKSLARTSVSQPAQSVRNEEWKNHYDVITKIGKGGFSVAATVKSKSNGRVYVAKKTTLTNLSYQNKKHAQNEVKYHSQLSFPFIVKFQEAFMQKEYIVIIMEYCEGGDLFRLIQHQKQKQLYFDENQIMMWFAQLLLAIDYIHGCHFLHLDLKSANVFFSKDYKVLLGDFGMMSSAAPVSIEDAKIFKSKKEINGTPEYLSPEQVNYEPPTYKSDVWGLGILLYEMTCLNLPFQGASVNQILDNISKKHYEPIPAHFSKDLSNLIQSLLCKKESLRLSVADTLRIPYVAHFVDIVHKQYML